MFENLSAKKLLFIINEKLKLLNLEYFFSREALNKILKQQDTQ